MSNPLDKIALSNPWHLLATGFGSGLSPIIPGTMGTLASIPFYLILVQLPLPAYLLAVVISCIVGIKICDITAQDMGVHDHGSIVWDEFAGFWITMSIVPLLGLATNDWKWVVAGFVLFRAFDMIKPWPISYLDKHVDGGFGIMIDDILAGVMAAISLVVLGKALGWF
ncbi:phosphatidylglycerophosphatase A [Vibrio gallicus]|uniref:phosphatidylglycerophosphatase A n=1 Tax=Vibrio gallicus TaxID=190897 RepID=UPI0021C3436E|nr:phosphatidylglycerophosphatase A [Vibrio gallicus]